MSTMNLKISIAPARANMKVTFGSGANAAAYLETLVATIARGPEGPRGPQGESIQGPRGIQGPQGETAVANINFRGPYVPGTPYYHADVNGDTDVVRSPLDGNTYYCLVDNTGNEPSTSPTYWTLFVMQGGRGEQGERGDKGDKGDRGPAGESIPKKAVMMFAGGVDEVPEGFWLCNGDDVPGYGRVPDLRSRFVVGLDPRATDYNAIGKIGGDASVLLSGAQSGVQAHDHDVPASTGKVDGTGSQQGIKPPGTIKIKTSLSVAKDATEAHENRPPYYTLAFIIRVSDPVVVLSGIESVVAGTNVTIDDTDPKNPIINVPITNGVDGITPHIGGNGNWFVGATDTGVKAQGTNGTSAPTTISIFKIGTSTALPQKFKWPAALTVTSVQLLSNCTEISVTIGSTTYNHTTLVGVTLTAGTELLINDITVADGQTNANALIIF